MSGYTGQTTNWDDQETVQDTSTERLARLRAEREAERKRKAAEKKRKRAEERRSELAEEQAERGRRLVETEGYGGEFGDKYVDIYQKPSLQHLSKVGPMMTGPKYSRYFSVETTPTAQEVKAVYDRRAKGRWNRGERFTGEFGEDLGTGTQHDHSGGGWVQTG